MKLNPGIFLVFRFNRKSVRRNITELIIALAFSIPFLMTFSSFAQTDTSRVLELELNEITVTLNKFEENKREQPIQTYQIRKKEIEFQNLGNTADLLLNSGNVFVQKSQGGGGSPVLRGFEASRVLLVIDGIRMNNAIYRSGHLQNILRIDQSILESAEVIFGPGSLIYGSDALGGVISFNSKTPKLNKSSFNAYTRYSTAINEKTVHVDINLGSKRLASFSSLTFSDFGDIKQGNQRREAYPDFGLRPNFQSRESLVKDVTQQNSNPNIQRLSGYSQIDLLQKVLFKASEKQQHILNFQLSLTGDTPRYDRLTELDSNGDFRFAEWYYGPEYRSLFAYELKLKGEKLYDNSSIKAAYQQAKESRHNRKWNAENLYSQLEKVSIFSLNADFIKHIKRTTYQYGLEYLNNDVDSKAFKRNVLGGSQYAPKLPTATRYPDGGSQVNSLSAYLTSKKMLVKDLLFLNYGLRYSFNNLTSQFEDKTFYPFDYDSFVQKNEAVVGNLGLTFLTKRKNKYSLLFSNGFRVPNVDDLAKVFDSAPGQVVVPNPNIKPEYTYNIEFGTEQNIAENFSVSTSIYTTFFDNAIVLRPFNLNGNSSIEYQGVISNVYANQNADNGLLYGGNITLSYLMFDNFKLASSYNLIKGHLTDISKTPLDHIPPSHGKSSISYKKSRFNGEVYSIYNGWKKLKDYSPSGEDNLRYATPDGMPSWYTLNLKMSFEINKRITSQFSLENMLDNNYRSFASGISAPGRNFIFTLRVKA